MSDKNMRRLERALIDATEQQIVKWKLCANNVFEATHNPGLSKLVLTIDRGTGRFDICDANGRCVGGLLDSPDLLSAVLARHRQSQTILNHAVEHLLDDLEKRTAVLP